ncbi:plasmid mobilization protein [Porphyromonas circumdentaria]|uniref:plasmid mobilization protein n=1 Tax=Porphyromonas circumdentaria TaxID=29524 RepID=UPI003F65A72A
MNPKTDKERRNKGNNKTRILRIRCSEEEQRKIQKRAEQSGCTSRGRVELQARSNHCQ